MTLVPHRLSRFAGFALAAAGLLLAGASLALYMEDSRFRLAAESFERAFSLGARWPADVKTMRLEPAGDLASDVAVHSSLREGADAVLLPEPSPGARPPAMRPRVHRSEELDAARRLMLEAIEARPGWAYHRFLLGCIEKLTAGKDAASAAPQPERWSRPLLSAAADAPGLDAIWVTLGAAYLENWAGLSPGSRAQATRVLSRAFLDPDFVAQAFPLAAETVGHAEAISLLPENSEVLRIAARSLAGAGHLEEVASLASRMESAERRERAVQLARIEERHRLGDVRGLRLACLAWIAAHPVGDFDDPAGRAQAARVLEIWPSSRIGSWRTDGRADLVRFFLNGRESDTPASAVARALEALSGVPDAIVARAKLLAGDVEGAEETASRSDDPDALQWTPYFVDLSRYWLRRGRAAEASKALNRVAAVEREECDVLLARREVARARKDGDELERVEASLEGLRGAPNPVDSGGGTPDSTLALCVDPEWAAGRSLAVQVQLAAPALLVYGLDGGRSGSVLAAESSAVLRVSLKGRSGRRSFSVRPEFGGPLVALHGSVLDPNR